MAGRGVRRLVAPPARDLDGFPGCFQGMAALERAVRESGVEWTILRPNNFNQNFSDPQVWLGALLKGRLALALGDMPEPFIDAEDIAEVSGRSIAYETVTSERYREELPAEGAPEEAAEELNALAGMRAGPYTEPRDGVRRARGRDPIDFGDYVARTVSAWC